MGSITATKLGPTFSRASTFDWDLVQTRDNGTITGESRVTLDLGGTNGKLTDAKNNSVGAGVASANALGLSTSKDDGSCISLTATKVGPTFSKVSTFDWDLSTKGNRTITAASRVTLDLEGANGKLTDAKNDSVGAGVASKSKIHGIKTASKRKPSSKRQPPEIPQSKIKTKT